MNWQDLSHRTLQGQRISRDEALALLESSDDELLAVLDAAFIIRKAYFGRKVHVQVIRNARSGRCSENCGFCSQSVAATSDIQRYSMQTSEEILGGAIEARRLGAKRYCIVTSGRRPSDNDIERICETARRIKKTEDCGSVEICTSLGILDDKQASDLRHAGVDRYNHNLETSERFFPTICSTHGYSDRIATTKAVKRAGLDLCCGGIIGLGETLADRVDLAFSVDAVEADSIPVNFFNPRSGTPLDKTQPPTPADCLRALAMFRFVNPKREIRAAGGREACLGALQALALYPANSIFTDGYLTTTGQGWEADRRMLAAAGFSPSGWTQA
ncbi:MAG: biotin synthase BioB [Vicinamibacteria bacterium]|nr:biotin synthase BioB [Vicinamibacteria bacterium]